jgi:hypothetical protein
MAEKAHDGIAVEEAIRRLEFAGSLLLGRKKELGQDLLTSLEKLLDRIHGQYKQDTSECVRGYF